MPTEAHKARQFCSMKITQDLRVEAAAIAERNKSIAETRAKFLLKGGKLYL